jgi:RES domain-containing protein
MILRRLGPEAPFYRALSPRWASRAESGAGAAAAGGRFNRPGIEARYLADTPAGALREYQQESILLPPATVATFLVTAEVVDFSNGYDPAHWSPLWAEAYCNWKGLAFLENIDPPSWDIGDLVRARGIAGILYRSTRDPQVRCIVLYPEFADRFKAPVHDPDGQLPQDARSWKPH